jgi:FkbM family methyltransferase
MKKHLKQLLKAPFRALGFDIVKRKSPCDSPKKSGFAASYRPEEHWLARQGIRTVLDVGAHEGQFARRIRNLLPEAELICFEPLDQPYAQLVRQFENQPRFRAIRCALGDKAGSFEIHHNEYSPSSSLLPMADLHRQSFEFAVQQKSERIEVRLLSEVARELQFEPPLLLKLDVQGFEDKVIAGSGNVLESVQVVIIEVSFRPLYLGGPLFDEIYRLLRERGFSYMGNFEQLYSPKDGSILQADAIFCRQE